MINEYTKKNISKILYVVNNAALKYRGIIPDDCWHEPYMLEKELVNEFNNSVRMFGYKKDSKLVGVMGIQELKNVTLIRHAYVLTHYQGMGVGKSLLQYLFKINNKPSIFVGTWREATWAIQFYKKFVLPFTQKTKLLNYLKNIGKSPQNKLKIL